MQTITEMNVIRKNNVETEKLLHVNKNEHESQQKQRNHTFSKFTTNDTVCSKIIL